MTVDGPMRRLLEYDRRRSDGLLHTTIGIDLGE